MSKWVYRGPGTKWERREEVDPLPQMEVRAYDRAHVSHQLPRKGTGIEQIWHKFDQSGRPAFETKRDMEEFSARAGGQYLPDF